MCQAAAPSEGSLVSSMHIKQAQDLHEDDRILLKDLRIFTVQGKPRNSGVDEVTIRYYELATQTYGELVVAAEQHVKVICEGWCKIDQELDVLL